jgi:hypothetical protein
MEGLMVLVGMERERGQGQGTGQGRARGTTTGVKGSEEIEEGMENT